MISLQSLFEIKKELPWRSRAEVFIIKNGKLIVGTPQKGWSGYIVPGGGIDENENPKKAAQREALEELGVKCDQLKLLGETQIPYVSIVPKFGPTRQREYIKKLISRYSGAIIYSFVGQFKEHDKTLWGKDIDSYNIKEITIQNALIYFKKRSVELKNSEDTYNYQKTLYTLKILKKIK